MGERQRCDVLLQEGLHGRLSGLASGFYGVLGANAEDLGITNHGPPPAVKSSATASKHITWILPMLLTSFIITVFLG
ncbi:hypothetical protein ABFV05_007535 [Capra hircus]